MLVIGIPYMNVSPAAGTTIFNPTPYVWDRTGREKRRLLYARTKIFFFETLRQNDVRRYGIEMSVKWLRNDC